MEDWPKEKRWKDLYLRSEKVHRAKQLGIDYPIKNQRQKLAEESINVLFVCSMNKWRSPTAEKIYKTMPLVNTRSGGTSSKAKHQVSLDDIRWADLVIAMESKHRQRLVADFPEAMRHREVHVLDIEDNYEFMNPELIDELRAAIDPIFELCEHPRFSNSQPTQSTRLKS
ncbi:MAG: hypothetical protein AAFX93_15570 [Verrucomicrobiota bacterium]